MNIDLHVHTKYSHDSHIEPKELLKRARKVGLSVMAVTDHDSIEGSTQCMRVKGVDIEIIPGCEVRTEIGDFCCLHVSEMVHSRTYAEVHDEVRSMGGLIVMCHPSRYSASPPELIRPKPDAVEIFNSRSMPAQNKYAAELASILDVTGVAVSDSHWIGDLGSAFVSSSMEPRQAIIRRALTAEIRFAYPLTSHFISFATELFKTHLRPVTRAPGPFVTNGYLGKSDR